MPTTRFYLTLAAVTAFTTLCLLALNALVPEVREHASLEVVVLLIFFLLSIGLFHAGMNTVHSRQKVLFNGLISGSVFGKMVLAIVVLFVYQSSAHPTNQWFVGVFLLVYVVFTVFEVWFLSRIAKS